jgi:hypothetical protein
MPRGARIAPGEIIYHALNRANGRSQLFDKPEKKEKGVKSALSF